MYELDRSIGTCRLEDGIDYFSLKIFLDQLHIPFTIDADHSRSFRFEYRSICIDNTSLGLSYEGFFIISCHFFAFGRIDQIVDKVECEKCSFRSLSICGERSIFLECSLLESLERFLESDREFYRDRFIEKLFIYSTSPPEESLLHLIDTHPNHNATYNKCFHATVHENNMILLECGDNLAFYSIEEICRLEEETGLRKNSLINFLE